MSFPTTSSGEKKRQMSSELLSGPGSIDLSRQVYGAIIEIHDSLPLVKAYDPSNGTVIANNRWIPLIHSPEEIVEKFGTIRIGMTVLVNSTGPSGDSSFAQIITNEHEDVAGKEIVPNTVDLGLWEIFTPGSGL